VTTALITGITGQDGGYLTEALLAQGVQVHGLVHHEDATAELFAAAHPEVELHPGDLADERALRALVATTDPDEIYNFAGISSVAFSWDQPALTGLLSGQAPVVLLDAAFELQERRGRTVAFVQASSAEIFGAAPHAPQDEATAVRPVSPYGAAKAYAHHMVAAFRSRGLAASSCILFNHESPRRPETFVTRKITAAAARIGLAGSGVITLGNLEARRDWGWAPDYVDAMVRAARYPGGGDFVIATGETHTVAEFAEAALRHAGVGDEWRRHVEVDEAFLRPNDAPLMVGDPAKARRELGWSPTVTFDEIVGRMVDHDLALLRSQA
jgi:GDPmannose 4,6-dehydratase